MANEEEFEFAFEAPANVDWCFIPQLGLVFKLNKETEQWEEVPKDQWPTTDCERCEEEDGATELEV